MCGRYTETADLARLAKRFQMSVLELLPMKPRYNIGPADPVITIIRENEKPTFEMMKWGLTRQWDKQKRPLLIVNLRADKLSTGPFRSMLLERRCLVPADGFFEWATEKGKNMPYHFTLNDGELFAFPAIYDEPVEGQAERTVCIFTTEANDIVMPIHHRMPAILDPALEKAWLDPSMKKVEDVIRLLTPYSANRMMMTPVSPEVNSAHRDDPELLKPYRK